MYVAAAAQQNSDRAGLIVEGDELVRNLMAPSQLIGAVVLSLVGVGRDQLQHARRAAGRRVGASMPALQSRPPGEPVVAGPNSEDAQELPGELP